MNLWMDLLIICQIQTGWVFTMETYPSGQFWFIDDQDCLCGIGLVRTRILTRRDDPQPLLTLITTITLTITTITITIPTMTIATITITSIGYITIQLFSYEIIYNPHSSETQSTDTSMLPAKPDCPRWEWAFHSYQQNLIVRGQSEHSTTMSLLPAKPHCQRGESEHVRAVRPSISGVGIWICQSGVSEQISGESKHVRVRVAASMSELEWEWVCQSCYSEHVRVYTCQSSK